MKKLYGGKSCVDFVVHMENEKSFLSRLNAFVKGCESKITLPDGRKVNYMRVLNEKKRYREFYYERMDVYSIHRDKCDDFKHCDSYSDGFHVEVYSKHISSEYEIQCESRPNIIIHVCKYDKRKVQSHNQPEIPKSVTLAFMYQFICQGCVYTLTRSVSGEDGERASKKGIADQVFTLKLSMPKDMRPETKVKKIADLFGQHRKDMEMNWKIKTN